MPKVKHHKLHNAVKSSFLAKRDAALATLDIYLNESVGVGDHVTHIEGIIKLLEQLNQAEQCLKTLTKHFGDNDEKRCRNENCGR